MTTLELHGRITEKGDLEVKLPAGLPAGEVIVRIDVPAASDDWERQPWTDEEIHQLMNQKRKSFKELVEWLDNNPPTEPWGDLRDDEDAGDYVHRMRRQPRYVLEDPDEDR